MPKRISLTDMPQIYSERTLTEILSDTLVPFNDNGSGRVATIPVNFIFEDGGKYHVVFDREEYDLVYSAGLVLSDESSLIFKLLVSNGDLEIYSDFSGSHTIQLYSVDEIVHKLPDKYAGSAKPDWNQNDETAPDYVKNRPFYTGDPVLTEIIPAKTVSFIEYQGMMTATLVENFDAVEGENYTISWDGTDYVCTYILSTGGHFLGNLGLADAGDDTGEPFLFIHDRYLYVYTTESATEHVIAISEYIPQIVQIDRKYLPSTPKFVVDATNLPTDTKAWGELAKALDDAYNSGHDIFLDINGTGSGDLKLISARGENYLFLYPVNDIEIYAYILTALYSDGGSLKKYSLTTTEIT